MLSLRISLLSAFVILSCSAWPWNHKDQTTLLLVQTIFRHGSRAPIELYPNDPNSADEFPNGLGRLTQLGKKQHYEVGKYLRSLYKDFITSDPKEIYVNSSAEERCLNSAESNLASFYAPTRKYRFKASVDWQPIPVHYLPKKSDIYLDYISSCHRSELAFVNALNSKVIQKFYRTHQTMVKDVSKYSGLNYSDPLIALYLFDTLEAEKTHNLIIPKWAKKYWNDMHELSNNFILAFYDSYTQLRLRSGPFLGLLTENLKKKINGSLPNLKFILNSSHDVNVAGILKALNFTNIPRPHYCATLMFELHKMADSSMTVRILYLNTTDPAKHIDKPQLHVLKGCKEFCPVEYFTNSYQYLIPNNWEEECQVET